MMLAYAEGNESERLKNVLKTLPPEGDVNLSKVVQNCELFPTEDGKTTLEKALVKGGLSLGDLSVAYVDSMDSNTSGAAMAKVKFTSNDKIMGALFKCAFGGGGSLISDASAIPHVWEMFKGYKKNKDYGEALNFRIVEPFAVCGTEEQSPPQCILMELLHLDGKPLEPVYPMLKSCVNAEINRENSFVDPESNGYAWTKEALATFSSVEPAEEALESDQIATAGKQLVARHLLVRKAVFPVLPPMLRGLYQYYDMLLSNGYCDADHRFAQGWGYRGHDHNVFCTRSDNEEIAVIYDMDQLNPLAECFPVSLEHPLGGVLSSAHRMVFGYDPSLIHAVLKMYGIAQENITLRNEE